MVTTTQSETANVKVEKTVDGTMGNQQPSACEMAKVQRLSRNGEYAQAGGSAEQPVCKDCGETDAAQFARRSDNGRYFRVCRPCRQNRYRGTQARYAARPEVRAKKQECDRVYAINNAESVAARKAEWTAKNRDRILAEKRAKYEAGKAEHLAKAAAWKRNNPAVVNARCARRHAAKLRQTPVYLSDFDRFVIEEIYDLAQCMTALTGRQYEVDHVIPLRGATVSGLHIPSNLRVIPGVVNARKSNRVEDIVLPSLKGEAAFYERRGLAWGVAPPC